jgi:hypothetical protein
VVYELGSVSLARLPEKDQGSVLYRFTPFLDSLVTGTCLSKGSDAIETPRSTFSKAEAYTSAEGPPLLKSRIPSTRLIPERMLAPYLMGAAVDAYAGGGEPLVPPCFVRFWDGVGLQRPYCSECVHFAMEWGTSRGLCWEYGAYVSLYSSCKTFDRRVNSSAPIVDEAQIKTSHRFGLRDLV